MPDLLLELFSEEIPARMQRKAAEDLRKLVTDALVEAGLVYEGARAFVTPRRLALTVHGIPARSPDRREERKGPRVGAPEQAIDGFLKAAGLTSIDRGEDPDRQEGRFLRRRHREAGPPGGRGDRRASCPSIVRAFPWPKSMRWGDASAKPGSLTWVRPLRSILCTFGPETEEPEVVAFAVDGIRSGNVTYGHRFLAPAPIKVRRFDDYVPKLEQGQGRARRRPPQGHHPRRRPRPGARAGPRAGRGRGAARGGRRPRRMAGRADGHRSTSSSSRSRRK